MGGHTRDLMRMHYARSKARPMAVGAEKKFPSRPHLNQLQQAAKHAANLKFKRLKVHGKTLRRFLSAFVLTELKP